MVRTGGFTSTAIGETTRGDRSVVGVMEDIAERKEAEEKIKRQLRLKSFCQSFNRVC